MRMQMAVIAALTLTGTARAQQMPDGSANRAAIERLSGMVGRYRGEAWMMRPQGRVNTTMTETIERKLGGAVLLIEGQGTSVPAAGEEARVVHHAMAVLSFDPQSSSYSMRSYLANGLYADFPVTVTAEGMSWSREVPGGRIRNTARIQNGEWFETGEFSRDGSAWTTIMEIRLRREN